MPVLIRFVMALSLCLLFTLAQGSVEDVFRFTTFCLEFVCYIALFLLTLFPEPRSNRNTYTLLQDDINEVKP